MRRLYNALCRSALLLLFAVPAVFAQTNVTGQVSLLERPGEQSEDLADVIVWLEPTGTTKARTAATTATIQLQGRQFSPRVRAVPEGSTIEFPNQDSFSHNVFSKATGGAFDTGVFGRGRAREQLFKEAGVFPIYCNIHPRRTGYVVVLKSPYYAQAGDDGRFAIAGVAPGSYTMKIWHDRASDVLSRPVVVSSAGANIGRVEMDVRGYRYVQHKNKFGQEYSNSNGDRY